jgi:hypothetical protein
MKNIYIRIWTVIMAVFFLVATFEHNFSTLRMYSSGLVIKGFPLATWSKVVLVAGIDLMMYFSISYVVIGRRTGANVVPAQWMLALSGIVSAGLNLFYMLTYSPGGILADLIGGVVGVLIPVMIVLLGWVEGDQKDVEGYQGMPQGEKSAPRPQNVRNKSIARRQSGLAGLKIKTDEPKEEEPGEKIVPKKKAKASSAKRKMKPVAKQKAEFTGPSSFPTSSAGRKTPRMLISLEDRVRSLLEADPFKSNRFIAKRAKCSPSTVYRVRRKYGLYPEG